MIHLSNFPQRLHLIPTKLSCSGLTVTSGYHLRELNQVISTSETILLHFYSDLAYNMSGFNISYR